MKSCDLSGKWALVTGSSRGIGRAIVQTLIERGVHVVGCSRSPRPEDLPSPQYHHFRADVTDPVEVRDLVEFTRSRTPHLDFLINNAGVARVGPLAEFPLSRWKEVLESNLTGLFLVTQGMLPLLRAGSLVVNILSIAAEETFPGWGAYSAAKAGALTLTRVLREELRSRGIRVAAVLPGAVDTPLWDQIPGQWDRSQMLRPQDVAEAVLWLCCTPPHVSPDLVRLSPAGGNL